MRYIALIHGDDKPGFGISFPDFPGCISDGDTMEDAIRRGGEALTFHIENMVEDGEKIPAPTACAEIETNPEMAAWFEGARVVEVEVADPPPAIPPAADPLVRCVGQIFGRRLARFVESSIVPDLPAGNWDGVKVILLLESPHVDEVPVERPLVGRSGKAVTEALQMNVSAMRGVDGAIGDLVARGNQRVSWLGIMNASRLPLKARAYPACGAVRPADMPGWPEFAKCLAYVRGDERPVTERNEAALLLEHALVEDLQKRLDDIPAERELLLVCCGEFAQRTFERTRVRDAIRIAYAPHPAGGWWEKLAHEMRGVYDGIEHMCAGGR